MRSLLRLYYTLRPLRWQQWWYRGWHPLVKGLSRPKRAAVINTPKPLFGLYCWPVSKHFEPDKLTFIFLNRKVCFGKTIDWAYAAAGPLWQFNLHYFEWLYDEHLSVADRLQTIRAFCGQTVTGKSMHGYPTSLRTMAWIWFDLKHAALTHTEKVRLFQDVQWLRRFPEYQLDGNHLFENAIALCTAGCYFEDEDLLASGAKLMRRCTGEQLYQDGGHCEGSPMYHSLLLWRLMQSLEIGTGLGAPESLLETLQATVFAMLGWLKAMTFSDGTWPAVNDAVQGIAPEPAVLFEAADALGISVPTIQLADCGYRMIRMPGFELFVDVDGIRPAWQPGHAHADTGNFCLHVGGRPIIVDTGCSTYEDPSVRMKERGTCAHNTIQIDGRNSSDIWSRFRVGRRCRVVQLREGGDSIYIEYIDADGHRVSRQFVWNDSHIEVCDRRLNSTMGVEAAIHFAPGVSIHQNMIGDLVTIEFDVVNNSMTKTTEIAAGFNNLLSSACLLLKGAQQELKIRIELIPK